MSDVKCAACGLPGHRYGRNEGMERFDPMACINSLNAEIERLRSPSEILSAALELEGVETRQWPGPIAVAPKGRPELGDDLPPGRYAIIPLPSEEE